MRAINKKGDPATQGRPKSCKKLVCRRCRCGTLWNRGVFDRQNADEPATAAPIFEPYDAGHEREKRVVFSASNVQARFVPCAALPNQNSAGIHQLSRKSLDAQPLPG